MDFTSAVNRYLHWLRSDGTPTAPAKPAEPTTYLDGRHEYLMGRPCPPEGTAAHHGWLKAAEENDPDRF
jgi:hypothetical protein